MTRSIQHGLPIFSWRFRQGADARLLGHPRDAKKSAQWLAGWDEGNDLINRVNQRAAIEAGDGRGPQGTRDSRSDGDERNGSSVVAFFVTFIAVVIASFPLGMVSQDLASLLQPDVIEPFTLSDWPLPALEGTIVGIIVGLWQANIASYPKGNAAGKKLWWQ
ncbi:hypothetical protein [Burkholderia multivorans]|uniref:hypothetical protein n=1 Tax=Burkholderia multivorans TaxID=87883 RepID=UPI001C220F0B|nr:hypothetical protein [Burkholderia multivorans]MBU9210927.1 hypothetical protein [Burkholderia multivorans]